MNSRDTGASRALRLKRWVLIDIQFVCLELEVCEKVNAMAQEQRRTVSELVNEILRAQLGQSNGFSAADGASL